MQEYVDAQTGVVIDAIPMRRFYEWQETRDRRGNLNSGYVMVRQYEDRLHAAKVAA